MNVLRKKHHEMCKIPMFQHIVDLRIGMEFCWFQHHRMQLKTTKCFRFCKHEQLS